MLGVRYQKLASSVMNPKDSLATRIPKTLRQPGDGARACARTKGLRVPRRQRNPKARLPQSPELSAVCAYPSPLLLPLVRLRRSTSRLRNWRSGLQSVGMATTGPRNGKPSSIHLALQLSKVSPLQSSVTPYSKKQHGHKLLDATFWPLITSYGGGPVLA
jgi:hypothetical protein